MTALGRELALLQPIIRGARQVAPVAILWPIRSFAALPDADFTADSPLRDDLVRLIRLCLDRQVGLHLLDEADLGRARPAGGEIRIGDARCSHTLIPSCLVLRRDTVSRLREASGAGVTVLRAGRGPRWQQGDRALEPLDPAWCPAAEANQAVSMLPRLVDLGADGEDIRCTAWERDGRSTVLLMNLRRREVRIDAGGTPVTLLPGKIEKLVRGKDRSRSGLENRTIRS